MKKFKTISLKDNSFNMAEASLIVRNWGIPFDLRLTSYTLKNNASTHLCTCIGIDIEEDICTDHIFLSQIRNPLTAGIVWLAARGSVMKIYIAIIPFCTNL